MSLKNEKHRKRYFIFPCTPDVLSEFCFYVSLYPRYSVLPHFDITCISYNVVIISRLFADVRMIRTDYVCEDDVMHLDCEPPNVLEIHGADYGGAAAFICGNGQGSNQTCSVLDRTQKVGSACNDKTSCSLAAMTPIFGDPCPGLNKYLNVMYACGKFSTTSFKCVVLRCFRHSR